QRERRVEVELLERPPRLAHHLRGPRRALTELERDVGPQLLEAIRVHRCPLRTGRDDDEVPVPRLQRLQTGEQFLPLTAALGPSHALIRLPLGKVEILDRVFLLLLRFPSTRGGGVQKRGGSVGRLEPGVEVHRSCGGEQSLAPLREGGIEPPSCTIESPRCRPRQRSDLLLAPPPAAPPRRRTWCCVCRPTPDRAGGRRAPDPRRARPRAGASLPAAQEPSRSAPYTSSASSWAGRHPSRTTIRSEKRSASSRYAEATRA